MTSTEKVIQKAIDLVESSPPGKRYSELVKEISTALSEIPINTIHGSLHKFRTELPATVYQPSRYLPLAHVPPSASHLKPLSKMG